MSLINADTDAAISPLTKDAIINTISIGTPRLNVRADADGSTVTVRFALDGSNVLDSTSPFTLGGDNGSDYLPFTFAYGTHTLIVTPYGGVGGTGTVGKALSITFFVDQTGVVRGPNQAPTVTLVSPTTTTSVAPGYSLLRADASDLDGFVSKVEFWADGSLISTAVNAPYLASWREIPQGTYNITARAYDNEGAIVSSAPTTITILPQTGSTFVVSPTGLDTNPGSAASPVKTINKAYQLAQPGDTVSILPGTYFESLTIKKSGVTFAAQSPGTVIWDGSLAGGAQRTFLLVPDATTPGTDTRFSGIIFRNAASGNHSDTAAVRTGDRWRLTDCTVELTSGNGIAILGSNATLVRVTAQDNGCSGIGGTSAKNAMMLDCISRRNNTAGNSGSTEGGGGKFTRTTGLLVEGYNSYQNNGPGLWFDYNNVYITVRNSQLHDNITLLNTDGTDRIAGTGLFFEISGVVDDGFGNEKSRGPLLAENNLIYNNQKYGITVYASPYVTITGNTLSGNSLELKDGRNSPFSIHHLTVVGNFFKNGRFLVDKNSAKNYFLRYYRIDSNTYDNTSGRLWNWMSTDLNTFTEIRALGFELHGGSGSITFVPPPSPVIAPSPASAPLPQSTATTRTPLRTRIGSFTLRGWRSA